MNKSFILSLVLAGGHLLLVVCGAVHWPLLGHDNPAGRTLRVYGAMTGADYSYGFFAPGVGSQLRATFVLVDKEGRTWTDVVGDGASHEAGLRMGNAISWFYYPQSRPGVAASLAGTMFGRHPRAEQILVKVEFYHVPTMAEFRAGERPGWYPMYEAQFSRTNTPATKER